MMDVIEKKVLTQLAKDFYRPTGAVELAQSMSLSHEKVEKALGTLAARRILLKAGADYSLNPGTDLVAGFFQSHVRGYGFVHVGDDRQYYLAPNSTQGARDGDILLCQVLSREVGKAPAVRVLEFLVRQERIIAAVFNGQSHLGSVQAGNKRVMIPSRHSLGAKDGDCVLVAIDGWEGRVLSLLPEEDKSYLDLMNIASRKGVLPVFPEAVAQEAASLGGDVGEVPDRLDLRAQEVVTVDGEEARDLDDGFSLERRPDGTWLLGVHIADVAHYVRPGSALDREALGRGLSVYLVDREVPMLPEKLSRDLCSLLPGHDRLAVSCLAEISPSGEVICYKFAETLVRSRQRLTYSQVEASSSALLAEAAELGQVLNARRRERGAAYIQLPTTAITLDADGRPIHMGPRATGGPRGLVEEFMVLANELAADYLYRHGVSLLYRGNEGFYSSRGDEVLSYLAPWGYQLDYPPTPRQLQQLMEAVRGRPEELLVSRKLARCLHKSRYSWKPLGHYNMATERYTHFSSPIRRYSDLFVHRQIKGFLNGDCLSSLERDLPPVAERCSYQERLAQDVEGACLEKKKLEYMATKEDQHFRGIVIDITGSGPLVWLENTAEGIVVAGDKQFLNSCQLGDEITVQIHKLSHSTNSIYFASN